MSKDIRWYKTYNLGHGVMKEDSQGYGDFISRWEAEDKIRALQRELDEYKQRDAKQYDAWSRNKEVI